MEVGIIIIYDFEIFKHDWLICWLDTETRKFHHIVNDKAKFEKFYDYYKHRIWVGYGSRNYDVWIAKAILCDFNPYDMSDWIINKEQKGFMFSKLLNKFPILNYDCSVGFRGLKELEAFMGHDIQETSVPFDIDRKLTNAEINLTLKYCRHDVSETFAVFIETKHEFESHTGLIKEFGMPITEINKTKAQLSAMILGASKRPHNDEFDISFPDTMELGKHNWIADWYMEWATNEKDYETMKLQTEVNGVPHTFGIGGLHGSKDKYFGEGIYIMADVGSYYPALMIEYEFLSRNVSNPRKYRIMRDERLVMKACKDPREAPRKIVLNGSFGASKDQYNALYDPLQANNTCIAGQLLLIDLLEKLEGKCELIQSNTDGILVKVYNLTEKDEVVRICENWGARTRMTMEYDVYKKVIQKDVNNYIIIPEGDLYYPNGNPKWKCKGAWVKELSLLDNDLPIVNKAVKDYFIFGIPVEQTIGQANMLMDFQKVTKISSKYSHGHHNGKVITGKVHRCFASADSKDGTLYKYHKGKEALEKTSSTPINCFLDDGNIENKPVPSKLDKNWYIDLANQRIKDFVDR